MPSTFAQHWSTALGINLDAIAVNNEGLSLLGQGMVNFLQACATEKTLEGINSKLDAFGHFGEDVRLKADFGGTMQINDDTKQLSDALLVQTKEAVEGKWPAAWGETLKEPLMIFVAYASAINALDNSEKFNWRQTLQVLTATFIREKGVDALRSNINGIDQLLPQVLTGAAVALLDEQSVGVFNKNLSTFIGQKQGENVKAQPLEILDILLAARTPQAAVDSPAPTHP